MEDLEDLKGQFYEGEYWPEGKKRRARLRYQMYLPVGVDTTKPLALILAFDNFNKPACRAVETLIAEGAMPPAVYLSICPAEWFPADGMEGNVRVLRMDNFDMYDPAYPNLLINEVIPLAAKNHGITITDDPDRRLVMGSSSGAIASWNIAWFRNDSFHRVYLSSPSFLSMGNGHEYPFLMYKFETKPIRVYLEYSENEGDDYFGSLVAVAQSAEHALKFAGYDPKVVYYPGEGHSAHFWDEKPMETALRYLWENWETEPVTVKRYSERFSRVFDVTSGWTKVDAFPDRDNKTVYCAQNGFTYVAEGKEIFAKKNGTSVSAYTLDHEIAALAIGNDDCRLYAVGRDFPCPYAMNIERDGALTGRYIQGAIHTYTDFTFTGGTALAADGHDRIYVATEMGIQCVRSFGVIDVISPMPGNAVPLRLALEERENGAFMVVATADDVYERRLSDYYNAVPKGDVVPHSYCD